MFYAGLDIHSTRFSVCALNESGQVVHRTQANKIRNAAITATFAAQPAVKTFVDNYIKATGYIGPWNMHHIWPLAWDGADHKSNLAPVPTERTKKGAGKVAHETHREWHRRLRTNAAGQPKPATNQLPSRQYPGLIGAHFKVKQI